MEEERTSLQGEKDILLSVRCTSPIVVVHTCMYYLYNVYSHECVRKTVEKCSSS